MKNYVKHEDLTWKGNPINKMCYEEVLTAYKEFQYQKVSGKVENADIYQKVFEAELNCLSLEKQVILMEDFKKSTLSRDKVQKIAKLSNAIISGIFQTSNKHKFLILTNHGNPIK